MGHLDVFKDGKQIDTLTPGAAFYKASQQTSTKPDIRSTFKEDLYLVYEGQNEKGQPIIKAHLNPMVIWIWLGVWIILGGTVPGPDPERPRPGPQSRPRDWCRAADPSSDGRLKGALKPRSGESIQPTA